MIDKLNLFRGKSQHFKRHQPIFAALKRAQANSGKLDVSVVQNWKIELRRMFV